MHNFRIEAHSMKGSLANIGATALSKLALELEIASRETDVSFCASNLPPFLERLNGLYAELKEAFAKKTHARDPIEISPELALIFEKLADAFGRMNFAAINKEMEKLDALSNIGALKEEIEKLKDAVLVMDYGGAVEVMQKLLHDS